MKLSFSLSSSKPPKPSVKPSQDHQSSPPTKEFLTEFDPSKPLTDPNSKNPSVIAPIANQWRPHKKMRNIDLPVKSDNPNLEFEAVSSAIEEIDSNISYGLNLRAKNDSDGKSQPKTKGEIDRIQTASSIDELMLNKLRNDLVNLPDDRGMDEFEDMPVENFATALLKGYGWKEGKGVGKNAKEDVKVFEFKKRSGKEGLGFVNDMPMPPANDSSNRASKASKTSKTTEVTVSNGERKERVHGGDRSRDSTGSRNRKLDEGEGYDYKKSSKRGRESEEKRGATRSKSWLSSHIRVRVISKELKGGRLYLQKGEIVDVVGPTTCDISMDNSREIIQGVDQEFLETALPKRGGPVLVLYGRHKGVYGSLQEKDMDNETAVVRDADTHALLDVKLDQIAEYLGDPDDIGY